MNFPMLSAISIVTKLIDAFARASYGVRVCCLLPSWSVSLGSRASAPSGPGASWTNPSARNQELLGREASVTFAADLVSISMLIAVLAD